MRWSSEFIAVYVVVVLSSEAVSRYKESKKLSGGWVRLTVRSFKIVNIFPLIFLCFYYITFVFPVLPHLHVLSSLFALFFLFLLSHLLLIYLHLPKFVLLFFICCPASLHFILFTLSSCFFYSLAPLFLQHNKDVVLKPLRTAWSFVSFLIKI